MSASFAQAREALARYARGLLLGPVDLYAAPHGVTRPFAVERAFYLPEAWPADEAAFGRTIYFAATAHLAAHARFGAARFERGGLKPIQIVLVSLLEDARLEMQARRELPGLTRLWAPFHRARPEDHPTFPNLCARISRALFDPAYVDPHPLVGKARALFFAGPEPPPPERCREIGSLLGHDVGQMRLPFNAREYAAEPAYRDDHRCLWEEPPASPPSETAPAELLERYAPARTDTASAQPPQADADEAAAAAGARPRPVEEGPAELAAPAARSARYPEWDYRIRRMRAEFATVHECEADSMPRESEPGAALALRKRRAARLSRRLQAQALARLRRQSEGDGLDLDRAIETRVDLRARRTPDERVYARTARRHEPLCVLLLIDLSRSTGDRVAGSAFSRLDLARDACLELGEALALGRSRFALHGFTSNGRHEVEYPVIKALHAPWDAAARARLRALVPRLSTRMGAALRHAGRHMAGVRERRRLILVLTDGEPSDVDAPDPGYLVHDARRAVDELRQRGHSVFAVSLDRDADPYVKRIFGKGRYAVVDRCERLPAALVELYATIAR